MKGLNVESGERRVQILLSWLPGAQYKGQYLCPNVIRTVLVTSFFTRKRHLRRNETSDLENRNLCCSSELTGGETGKTGNLNLVLYFEKGKWYLSSRLGLSFPPGFIMGIKWGKSRNGIFYWASKMLHKGYNLLFLQLFHQHPLSTCSLCLYY